MLQGLCLSCLEAMQEANSRAAVATQSLEAHKQEEAMVASMLHARVEKTEAALSSVLKGRGRLQSEEHVGTIVGGEEMRTEFESKQRVGTQVVRLLDQARGLAGVLKMHQSDEHILHS